MYLKFKIDYPKNFGKLYSLNTIYSGKHWAKRQQDKDYWYFEVINALRKAGIKPKIFKNPVQITFYWNDGLDCSNHAYAGKMIEDALKGYLIKDDTRKYVKKIVHAFHNKKYIEVEIREV